MEVLSKYTQQIGVEMGTFKERIEKLVNNEGLIELTLKSVFFNSLPEITEDNYISSHVTGYCMKCKMLVFSDLYCNCLTNKGRAVLKEYPNRRLPTWKEVQVIITELPETSNK